MSCLSPPRETSDARRWAAARARLGLAACLLITLSGACGRFEEREPERAESPPPTVEVTVVRPELLIDTVALTGQLEAENAVVMKPEVDGVVESIEFVEGQPVAKGDVLIRLRDDFQRARVAETKAELELAEGVYEREKKLAQRNASSLATIEEARANVETTRARLDLARIELERTRIRAPFDGTAGARLVAPGARVEDRDGLVEVAAIDRLQLIFTVTEQAVALARVGAPIHVRVAAWPDRRFPGEVFFVSPTIDPAARRLVLKAWVPNAEHALKPGMFANVDVQIAKREGALMVPEGAMVYDRHGTYVWRMVGEDQAEKVPVQIGLRQAGRVEIVAGIRPGDVVVSAGTHKVMAGTKVHVSGQPDAAHASEGKATEMERGS